MGPVTAEQFGMLVEDLDAAIEFCNDSPHIDFSLWAFDFARAQRTALIIQDQLMREETKCTRSA